MNEARQNYRRRINFVDANLDRPRGKELATEHGTLGYPILLFLDGDGNQVNILRGVLPSSIIEQAIEDLLAREKGISGSE